MFLLFRNLKEEFIFNQGIYKITNKLNGKVYIGSSNNLKKRKKEHIYELKNNIHCNIHLQRAYDKYGLNNFSFEIIECVENIDYLLEREQYYMDLYNSYNREFGYNICSIAGSNLGFHHSDKTKEIFRENSLGDKNNFYGKHHSKETKNIISEKVRGENHNRAKLSEDNVINIYKLLEENKLPLKNIAKMYNVAPNTITQIKNGVIWSHIYYLYHPIENDERNRKLTESNVLEIYDMIIQKVKYDDIAKKFNICRQTISLIKRGDIWNHLFFNYTNKINEEE